MAHKSGATFEDKSHVGMSRCFYCGEYDKILLDTRLAKTLPHDCGVIDMEPCPTCKDLMKQGVILIAVDPASMERVGAEYHDHMAKMAVADERSRKNARPFIPDPVRTGGWFVVSDAFIQRTFKPPAMVDMILKGRWSFIAEDAVRKLGLYEATPTYKTVEEACGSAQAGS